MIYINNVKQYCKEYWKIENYQEAVNDTTQPWACHHRYEIDYNMSALELQGIGFYFNRPPHELIFLTHAEHSSLHSKGKLLSEETKQKLSNKLKGRPNILNLKYHISEEELHDLYVVQGLSTYKIAEMYGCTPTTIWLKLKKYNIIKNGR